MNILFGSRKRLRLPSKHRCSVPGCTVPLWPPGENLYEDGYDMREGSDMIHRNVSFNQICYLCNTILCRYHLSSPIDFVARWSYDFREYKSYPSKARLCQKCILKTDIEFVEWQNEQILKGVVNKETDKHISL